LPSISSRTSRSPADDSRHVSAPSLQRGGAAFDDELTLADYARLLKRWWWLATGVLVTVVAVVGTATAIQDPQYRSQATVLIRTESSARLFPLGGSDVEGRTMAAEADFLASTRYLDTAEEAAGADDLVEVDVGDTDAKVEPSVITFTAFGPTAEQAATTAQAWAEAYIDLRHEIDVADIEATITSLESTKQALDGERDRVLEPVVQLDAEIAAAEADTVADLQAQRLALWQTLSGQLQPIDAQLATVNTDLAELSLKADLLADPEVSARVNSTALLPDGPSSPQTGRNLALGAVVGAILAVGAVVAVASFDDRLRTTDDVEEATGLSNLTSVPVARSRHFPLDLPPGSPVTEAFQRVVSALDFAAAAGRRQQVLLVTSAQAGEGKTSTAARLAMALAAEQRNVLVIGGDLRRPTLAAAIGAHGQPGLADYLTTTDTAVEQCMHRVANLPHLVTLPAGRIHDGRNPAEVLRSPDLEAVIEKLREYCHHIIIDGPPLLPVVDALELASVADVVVLSVMARRSRGRALQRAVHLLDEAGPSAILGYVLNGVQRSEDAYGGRY
jgi:capsular exopolysaccharide synthesis family protein